MLTDPGQVLAVLGAGLGAGFVFVAVGAGSLVSFPILVGIGIPPLVANVSNNVGLVPGGLSGSWGYRRELAGHRRLVVGTAVAAGAGALVGAGLLLALPSEAFASVVPLLVLVAATLVGIQPMVSAFVRRAAARRGGPVATREAMGPKLSAGSMLVGVYGGYFGAAQGVLLVALLALGLDVGLQTVNGLKNIAVLSANLAASVVFVLLAPLDWGVVGLLAVGSVVGGWVGAHVGRRMPPAVYRAAVVLLGYVVGLKLLLG